MKKTVDVAEIIAKIKLAMEQKEVTKKYSTIVGVLGMVELAFSYFLML